MSAPILAHFDETVELTITTNASIYGLGAVLSQQKEFKLSLGEKLSVVAYLGRSVSDTEKRYHSNELECLAVIWAVEKWRHFLHGRHFFIKTDNSCVV